MKNIKNKIIVVYLILPILGAFFGYFVLYIFGENRSKELLFLVIKYVIISSLLVLLSMFFFSWQFSILGIDSNGVIFFVTWGLLTWIILDLVFLYFIKESRIIQ